MADIGVYEAKTHLASLLTRVERGERFVITRHGKPIAQLVPAEARDAEAVRKSLVRLRSGREALARRGVRLEDLLGEGGSLRDLAHKGHRL
jgi:prevent-host-death family protein